MQTAQPRNIKYPKQYKKKIQIKQNFQSAPIKIIFSQKGVRLDSVEFGILTARQRETIIFQLKKLLGKKGIFRIYVDTMISITKKPLATRIGKGKGNVSFYYTKVSPGDTLLEIFGLPEDQIKKDLLMISKKLQFKTKIRTNLMAIK